MSFKSVWGFDPDEVLRAQKLGRREPDVDASEEQWPPHMPLDVSVQMYELRRMYGS